MPCCTFCHKIFFVFIPFVFLYLLSLYVLSLYTFCRYMFRHWILRTAGFVSPTAQLQLGVWKLPWKYFHGFYLSSRYPVWGHKSKSQVEQKIIIRGENPINFTNVFQKVRTDVLKAKQIGFFLQRLHLCWSMWTVDVINS